MSLESCPECGYALSISDHHCRNCATLFEARPWFRKWDAKLLLHLGLAALAAGVLIYRLFFFH